MWHTLVLIVHVFVAFSLIGLVLLQRGKGAEAGTGFGAGASGTVFGARGSANFLSRTTAILATLFFATCLGLVYLSTQAPREESLAERASTQQTQQPSGVAAATEREPAPGAQEQVPSLAPAQGASTPESGGAAATREQDESGQ